MRPPSPLGWQRIGYALVGLSAGLLLAIAGSGPSAASPGLPARGWLGPSWSFAAGWSSGWVSVLLYVAYAAGALGVAAGLWAARSGVLVSRRTIVIACAAAFCAILLPPFGSGDHLNYAAYGRIAAGGGDPYLAAPKTWAGGQDPITSAVDPPWDETPSIYGPVTTLLQAGTSLLGGSSLRATVWFWQLLCLGAWLSVGLILLRRNGSRAAWLWLLNPVLAGVLLFGAHVDLIGAACSLGVLLLAGRRPLLAGVFLGAAIGVKLTAILLAPAVFVGLWVCQRRNLIRSSSWGILGVAVVLVPAQLWAGPHVFDQLQRARRFVSLATPWRPLVDALTGPLPAGFVRTMVSSLTLPATLLVAYGMWRILRNSLEGKPIETRMAGVAACLGGGYILAAPYSLPWYDAMLWLPLAFIPATALDGLALIRLLGYAVAYVPGRVIGIDPRVNELTLGVRRGVIPWLGWGLLLAVLWLGSRAARMSADPPPPDPSDRTQPRPPTPPPPAPAQPGSTRPPEPGRSQPRPAG